MISAGFVVIDMYTEAFAPTTQSFEQRCISTQAMPDDLRICIYFLRLPSDVVFLYRRRRVFLSPAESEVKDPIET